jgi:hypothetical protein
MAGSPGSRSRILFALLALALGLGPGASGSARATPPEECPTWFPDFRCERSGRYEGFQKPIVQPFLFEDPFITTGAYPYLIWHEFPDRSALGGGYATAVALQLRLALTERLAFIATKDGYKWQRPDSALLEDQQGFFNIAGGFKYALIDDPEHQFILSPALRLEVSTGSSDVFEGGSDALVIPSISAAKGFGDLHLIGGLGGQIPTDGRTYSSSFFYHLYADYALLPRFQPFVQLSGIHYIESGDGSRTVDLDSGSAPLGAVEGLVGDFEGIDLHNLGAKGVDANDYLTLGVGTHVPITRHLTFSLAYERPISSRKDIMKQRVTSSLRIEF